MSTKTFLLVLALAMVKILTSSPTNARADEASKPGLIGIQYGSEDFRDPEGLVRLEDLDQRWGEDNGFGKQWAGKWQGLIIGPATGEVRFTLDTDHKAEVGIAGEWLLTSNSRLTVGGMEMVKGQKYPIVLRYVKEGTQYDCYLKVQWSWANQTRRTIESDSLVYSAQTEAELKNIVGEAEEEGLNEDEDEAIGLADGVVVPDSDMVALWLLDESDYPHTTLTDASEYAKADLCLMDGGSMVPGRFGNALQVAGSDYAVCYAGFAGKLSEEELRERDGTPSGL